MEKFNLEEFIDKRVKGTADIIKGIFGSDSDEVAKGVLKKTSNPL